MPKVSVIIPTYNRANFIEESIRTVLNQTYGDFELIVVDDGSTDNTAAVVGAVKDKRIRYIVRANGGPSAARNTGIAAATGELLTFLDSDDWMLPHNLSTLVGLLDEQPGADVAYGWLYLMDPYGMPIDYVHGEIKGPVPPQLDEPWPGIALRPSGTDIEGQILNELILEPDGTIAIGAAVVRRTCVDAVNGFDPARRYQEHWDFYLRLAAAGCTYACSRQAVLAARIHSGGLHKNRTAMYAARLDILERMLGDSRLKDRLAPVYHQAYFNTHIAYAGWFYYEGRTKDGALAVNAALEHGALREKDIMEISRPNVWWCERRALSQKTVVF